MEIPESVTEAIREATLAHLGDVSAGIEAAVAAVRALPEFRAVSGLLVDFAVQELVYRERGRVNVAIASRAAYTGRPKVNVADCDLTRAAAEAVYDSVYNHTMAGKRLGDLTGLELDEVAAGEREKASGHLFNEALALWCRRNGVGDNDRVREKVPLEKLKRAYERLKKRKDEAATARAA